MLDDRKRLQGLRFPCKRFLRTFTSVFPKTPTRNSMEQICNLNYTVYNYTTTTEFTRTT